MPLFDFHCQACDKTFEKLVRSDTQVACPHCGSADVSKCVSKPAEPGKSKALLASARAQASKEGHFSNYSRSERKRAGV